MNSSSNIKIDRKNYDWGRAYIVEGTSEVPLILPSVTTVLKLLKNEKYDRLREQFGDARWDKIMSDAAERGNHLHKMLELFLLEWAKEKNAKSLFMIALEDDRAEKMEKVYIRAGFTPLERTFVKEVK